MTPAAYWKSLPNLDDVPNSQVESFIVHVLCSHCFVVDQNEMVPVLNRAMPYLQQSLQHDKTHISRKKLSTMVKVAALNSNFDEILTLKKQDEKRYIFEGALVVLLYFQPSVFLKYNTVLYHSIDEMLEVYPEFMELDLQEKQKLQDFSNFMKLGILLQPAKSHKGHLLDLVTRVTEGCDVKYICGSGQSAATNRRVLVFEREAGVTKTKHSRLWKIPWSIICWWLESVSQPPTNWVEESTTPTSNIGPKYILDLLQQFDPMNLVLKTVVNLELAPDIHLEAHELASVDGLTIIRTLLLTRHTIIKDRNNLLYNKKYIEDIARSFSISHPSMDSELWEDEHIPAVEAIQIKNEGFCLSQQINNINGQLVNAVSLAKRSQSSENLMLNKTTTSASSLGDNDFELFDWLNRVSVSSQSVSGFRLNRLSSFPTLSSVILLCPVVSSSCSSSSSSSSSNNSSSSHNNNNQTAFNNSFNNSSLNSRRNFN